MSQLYFAALKHFTSLNLPLSCIVFLVILQNTVHGELNWTVVKDQHIMLYNAYTLGDSVYSDTLPTDTPPLDVSLGLEMYFMNGFDAVSGSLDIVGSMTMQWKDSIAILDGVAVNPDVNEIAFDYRKIWTPVIVLINAVDSVQRVGDETYKVRMNLATGETIWNPRMIIHSSCAPDMTYFPFDEQKCNLTYTPWFQSKSSVRLSLNSSAWGLAKYKKNGIWTIKETESKIDVVGDNYYAIFTVTFKRESIYFTLNMLFPILLLSILGGFVFLLPAASGERLAFGIMCFLSFVVLLQTMMQFLPQSSAPMSILCYYVILMMTFSAVICIVTIILLRVYNKPETENVPKWLIRFIKIIRCVKCRRQCSKTTHRTPRQVISIAASVQLNNNAVEDIDEGFVDSVPKATLENCSAIVREHADRVNSDSETVVSDVDWNSVGNLLDLFFLVVFIAAQGVFSVFFLVPLAARYM